MLPKSAIRSDDAITDLDSNLTLNHAMRVRKTTQKKRRSGRDATNGRKNTVFIAEPTNNCQTEP